MPTKPVKKFEAWSYSRLTDYEGCPLKAKLKHLEKIPEPPAPAMARGRAVHEMCEGYVLGKIKKLPEELKNFTTEFIHLKGKKKSVQTELQLGLNKQWLPCSWFGAETWCRIVVDCMYDADEATVHVIDYKTGKVNPSHNDQMSLYAIGAFAYSPQNIKRVDTLLWYLDAGEESSGTFMRNDVSKLQKQWEKRSKKMLIDTSFKPTPGNSCRWCAYSKAKGGPCKF